MILGVSHIFCGVTAASWWFLSIGVYYGLLGMIRLIVLRHRGRKRKILRFAGYMLMLLSIALVGIVVLAFVEDRGTEFPLVIMLAVAVYAFTKITLAATKWIRNRKRNLVKQKILQSLSLADAFVSIYSLQRSMLVSFEGMTQAEIRGMNLATGSAVCIVLFFLGAKLLPKHRTL